MEHDILRASFSFYCCTKEKGPKSGENSRFFFTFSYFIFWRIIESSKTNPSIGRASVSHCIAWVSVCKFVSILFSMIKMMSNLSFFSIRNTFESEHTLTCASINCYIVCRHCFLVSFFWGIWLSMKWIRSNICARVFIYRL